MRDNSLLLNTFNRNL